METTEAQRAINLATDLAASRQECDMLYRELSKVRDELITSKTERRVLSRWYEDAKAERDKLHSELVEVRSALATVSEERDSLRTALTAAVTAERNELAAHVSAHVDALVKSNAQCATYHQRIERLADELSGSNAERDTMHDYAEKLHTELVEVRAALATVSQERDSLKRTLKEWEEAETKPHERVEINTIAEHVVPPVVPLCTTCHECGAELRASPAAGSHSVLYCRTERCSRKNTAWKDEISPYAGQCKSATPVRHE